MRKIVTNIITGYCGYPFGYFFPNLQRELCGIPGIFFNTLPKSGTLYIGNTLAKGLFVPRINISSQMFPEDYLFSRGINRLSQGGGVAYAHHLPAKPVNLAILNHMLDRMIIHVRDPRQAMLSDVHHFIKLKKNKDFFGLATINPALPDGYFSWDLQAQIDYQIDVLCKQMVQWVEDWVTADNDPEFQTKILFTRYEDFKQDQDDFFNKILQFYDIKPSHFKLKIPSRARQVDKLHFRQGSTDEWRSVFTPEQVDKATALIPEYIAKRFDWNL